MSDPPHDAPPPRAPVLVAIAGGSGSGKTTLARALVERLGAGRAASISQDSYYRDLGDADPAARNFDHPESLDLVLLGRHLDALRSGRPVELPRYDFTTHRRLPGGEAFAPRPVIVVDGILLLADAALARRFDLRVFVEAAAELRLSRRIQRDLAERGRRREDVLAQWEATVRPMHAAFVEPSRGAADLVLSGETGEGVSSLLRRVADLMG